MKKPQIKKLLRNNWEVVVLVLLSLLTTWPLFKSGYFTHHDDLQIIRIFEMRRCLSDFQIPCRWTPDMGFGYGLPMFNYYGPFPYIIGAIVSFFANYIISAKIIFFLPLLLGGIFVYLLVKEVFGKESAFLSGILYLFAPYRAVDSYVRGAITELYAITLIPIVLYFFLKLKKEFKINNFFWASLSFGVFLINHNLFNMVFTPVLFIWIFILVLSLGTKNLRYMVLSLLFGFGLASFFIIPAFFERSLIQIDNLKESVFIPNFRAHFVTLRQLFLSRYWGYGASTWLEADKMSFQVGLPHWILALVSLVVMTFSLIKKYIITRVSFKKIQLKEYILLFLSLILLVSLFMSHNKSAFIWERINSLQFMQFPWRFLGIAIFSVSILGGLVMEIIGRKWRKIVLLFLLGLTIGLNVAYFRPDKYFLDRTDLNYLSGDIWNYQRQGAIGDYLPVGVKEPKVAAPDKPVVIEGSTSISNYKAKSNQWSFDANSKILTKIVVPIFNFPIWVVKNNGQKIEYKVSNDGLIVFDLPSGKSQINGRFINTPIRNVANTISVLSMIGIIFVVQTWKKLKK